MTLDLRTAPLADVRALDLRAADRDPWADEAAIWARLGAVLDRIPVADWDRPVEESHARLVALARDLPLDVIRSDEAWSWVFLTLRGHALDHLEVLEQAAARAASA